ncbi:MAG: response regulator transcription factor [Planctomycetota bacterium]|nr:response regulator transcription factor [Planctomycetota bacterium]
MRVLIIEDSPPVATAIQQGLQDNGFDADTCYTGFEGEDTAATHPYDMILLDIMLPDRHGLDVCRNIRRRSVSTPIILVTGLSDLHNRVEGLDAGADDIIIKPFEFSELLARIRARLRRNAMVTGRHIQLDDLELDLYTRRVRRAGSEEIALSNREFALLEYLMRHPGKVLPRAEISRAVWETDLDASSNVIDVYVAALRRKLDRGRSEPLIQTIKNIGYRIGRPASEPGRDAPALAVTRAESLPPPQGA